MVRSAGKKATRSTLISMSVPKRHCLRKSRYQENDTRSADDIVFICNLCIEGFADPSMHRLQINTISSADLVSFSWYLLFRRQCRFGTLIEINVDLVALFLADRTLC